MMMLKRLAVCCVRGAIAWSVLVAALSGQTRFVTQIAMVEERLVEGRPPVVVVRANGPIAWRVMEPQPGDAFGMLRLRLYGISRGQASESLQTSLGTVTLLPDGPNLVVTLVPPAPLPGGWNAHLGRDADTLEIERK